MGLSLEDRAFIRERVAIDWAHHFIVGSALVRVGESPWSMGRRIVRGMNYYRNQSFFDLPRQVNSKELRARVQAIAAIRFWQEYMASMETVGAFLRAIRERGAGGVLWQNFAYEPRQVREFYASVRRRRAAHLGAMLNLPELAQVREACPEAVYRRAERLYPWAEHMVREIASVFLMVTLMRPVGLLSLRRGKDPRREVFVFVEVPSQSPGGGGSRRDSRGVLERAMNKLKHGFNATTSQVTFAKLGAGRRIRAVALPKQWPVINQRGQNIETMGVLGREIGRLLLDLDEVGAL